MKKTKDEAATHRLGKDPATRPHEYRFGGVVFEEHPDGGWYTWEGADAVYPYLFPSLAKYQFRVRPVQLVEVAHGAH